MEPHIVNVHDRPNIEAGIKRPREGVKPPDDVKSTHYLGRPEDDPMDPQLAPYAYYIHRPTGDVTPDHSHRANRVEFVVEGKSNGESGESPPGVRRRHGTRGGQHRLRLHRARRREDPHHLRRASERRRINPAQAHPVSAVAAT